MAIDLTSLVHNLHLLSNGGGDPSGLRADKRYQEALHSFWRADARTAAERISQYLADQPEGSHVFAAYRLWIEAAAEAADHAQLVALGEHLFARGREAEEGRATYVALRGLVHLELDEVSAAKLICRGVRSEIDDPYCMELVQRVDARFESVEGTVPALLTATTRLDDYFHWQSLCRGLIARAADEATQEAMAHVANVYRGSPLPALFEFHRSVEKGYFAAAAMMAERLAGMFPDNMDYRYYHAYALFEDGNYPGAKRILTDCVRRMGETDPEIVGLLGHCHAKMGEAERAQHYLKAAQALLKSEGLPSSHVSLELANVEDELRGDALDPAIEMPREPQNWLMKLSPRRYNELLTSSEQAIEKLLKPMGSKPRPGDYCFFACEEAGMQAGKDGVWKIVAVYAVDSDPMWHPTQGFHTALRLVTRLPIGIPLDVQLTDGGKAASRSTLAAGEPLKYGVYEIDGGALDILERAVKMNQDEMIERRRNAQSRRPTA